MSPALRKFFRFLNKYFMAPLFRLGFGSFFGNPLSGYIMVLKVIGRKSGLARYAPVNYFIHRGNIHCISGGRKSSDWYRNLMAAPEVEVILPGGAVFGRAEEVVDPNERVVITRGVFQNAGFAAFFEGYNPWKISNEDLAKRIEDLPVLRIRPLGVGNGAFDPAGWAWVWAFIISIIAILWIVF
ncbi:MAG: nitroreductase family deazaflavin-dependent oxidoreductase [Anaerolineales bacterium]|nr:nitroreductase family deazaflavin-dependent oxidoreductase [Anaerolineales bacterium]